MKNIFQSRRNKSPHNKEESEKKETAFFSKEQKAPFFNNPKTTPIQAKLTIGQSGDKYEKEADSMAEAVVNKTRTPAIQNKEISGIQRESLATPLEDEKLGTAEQRMEEDKLIQEKPELQKTEGEEEGIINKMEEEEEETLQAKSNSNVGVASKGLTQQVKSKSGKGRPLSKTTQREMESSFKTDFSGVNIHTDQEAVKMNKELGAQAFTHGKDVYFNSGKYNPETSDGKRLLAHELTHVVQQNKSTILKKDDENASSNSVLFGVNPLTGLKKGDGLNFGTFHLRPRVQLLQQKLNEKTSFGLAIDGMFGPKTLAALRFFRTSLFIAPPNIKDTENSLFQQVSFQTEDEQPTTIVSDEVVDPVTADALISPLNEKQCSDLRKAPQSFKLGKAVKDQAPMQRMVCTETGVLRVKGTFNWNDIPFDRRMRIEVFLVESGKDIDINNPFRKAIVSFGDTPQVIEKVFDVPPKENYQFNFIVHKKEEGKSMTGHGKVHDTKK
ncbi:MAG: DUF4157 domain-containing protein [Flavobacteriaceae bacterium]|nr:DUF4157 domain-containing protein [Flavobacteriaceae bacterium]